MFSTFSIEDSFKRFKILYLRWPTVYEAVTLPLKFSTLIFSGFCDVELGLITLLGVGNPIALKR